MARFLFRPQAALELRRRQLEAAQRDLAIAERDRLAVRRRVEEADVAIASAAAQAAAALGAAGSAQDREWYRFWIHRLRRERDGHAASLTARESAVQRATQALMGAKQRCESLERLRAHARRAYDEQLAAEERKLIDELATQQFAARARHKGATP
ncbi:MAG: flagellar export protein FliJ [Vicinamibacterales bacterium]